jgi:Zn-dependent M28 family amino/carboxypeptidase
MFDMPGQSHTGPLPKTTERQQRLQHKLKQDVTHLSQTIGPRHVNAPNALDQTESFIVDSFQSMGYTVERQTYEAMNAQCTNLIVEIPGTDKDDEIVVLGAHYDTVPGSPGANDNATGVAALLALARIAQEDDFEPTRTLRFVAFVNEEPPFFQTEQMGSHAYAKRCHQRGDNIVAMLSFDGLGYYSNAKDAQTYPLPLLDMLYPKEGNFIAFVGNWSSRQLVYDVVESFRCNTAFPSQGGAVPNLVPEVGFSDHWAFWQFDYPAVMVTDTLPFRDPHYHTANDTIDHLDFDSLARVVTGLDSVMRALASPGS